MLYLDLNGDWSGNRLLLILRPLFWLKYGYLLCSLGLTTCRMFRSSSEALPSWIGLARFNWSSFRSYMLYPLISGYTDPIWHRDSIGSLKADARVVPGSRPWLGLMFTRVYACRQIVKGTFAPSWSGIDQVARPASPEASACAGLRAVDRGSSACQRPGDLPALRVACRYSPVGFDRQQCIDIEILLLQLENT